MLKLHKMILPAGPWAATSGIAFLVCVMFLVIASIKADNAALSAQGAEIEKRIEAGE